MRRKRGAIRSTSLSSPRPQSTASSVATMTMPSMAAQITLETSAVVLERGLAVDHAILKRWVLAYAPVIERRLRAFRKPHCGSLRIDETYIKIRGQWRYLYRALDKHGTPVDFLLTATHDLG